MSAYADLPTKRAAVRAVRGTCETPTSINVNKLRGDFAEAYRTWCRKHKETTGFNGRTHRVTA